jgi:hypothetical protein
LVELLRLSELSQQLVDVFVLYVDRPAQVVLVEGGGLGRREVVILHIEWFKYKSNCQMAIPARFKLFFGPYLDNKTIRVDILRNPPPKPKCSWCVCKKPRV